MAITQEGLEKLEAEVTHLRAIGFDYSDARMISLKNQIDAWRRVMIKKIAAYDERERQKAANANWGLF